jgi:hypothetical protein
MAKLTDTELVIEKAFEILGGKDEARRKIDSEFFEMQNIWDQDVDVIGRILRAHLYVEHYLTEYLRKANPRLGNLNSVRISFSQKIDLLDSNDAVVKDIIPGIRHLNKIRNRLAHNLSVEITEADVAIFLSNLRFKAFREAGARPNLPNLEPMIVLEKFAQYAASSLNHQSSSLGAAFKKIFAEQNNKIT